MEDLAVMSLDNPWMMVVEVLVLGHFVRKIFFNDSLLASFLYFMSQGAACIFLGTTYGFSVFFWSMFLLGCYKFIKFFRDAEKEFGDNSPNRMKALNSTNFLTTDQLIKINAVSADFILDLEKESQ